MAAALAALMALSLSCCAADETDASSGGNAGTDADSNTVANSIADPYAEACFT